MATDAAARVADMANKLAGASQFSVTLLIRYDAVQASGQVIEFSERRELTVHRPDGLRVDVRQSDGDQGGLVFNGKTISQFNVNEAVYTQLNRPGDVDSTIRYAVSELGVRFPLARLLVTSLPREISRLTTRVDFVETDTLGQLPTVHLAGVSQEVDYQFWIREDDLPSRIVLTYRNAPGRPRFSADFVDWNMAPDNKPGTFEFVASAGAEKIPTLVPAARSATSSTGEGSAQ
jgi:hypothetical protein